jgi:hypothetical protein
MRIAVELAFDEMAAVRLLNWLARENAIIIASMPGLPYLYESGVFYRREKEEVWSDYLNLLGQGHEDCDALAAARAGEIMARGWRALSPRLGDYGWRLARDLRLRRIYAEVVLRTRTVPGETGMYHCIPRYRIAGRWYYDDPSARLGMYGYKDLRQPPVFPLPRRPALRAA